MKRNEPRRSPKEERAINRKEVMTVSKNMYQKEMAEEEHPRFERIENLRSIFYGGIDPRRRQELADGGMIEEDPKAMANCPLQAQHHEYPAAGYYSTPYIDDTVDNDRDF